MKKKRWVSENESEGNGLEGRASEGEVGGRRGEKEVLSEER